MVKHMSSCVDDAYSDDHVAVKMARIAIILVIDVYDGDKVKDIINHEDSNVHAPLGAIKPANTGIYGVVLNYVFMYSIARNMHDGGHPGDDIWILQLSMRR